jgi:hypothetical protein
MAIVCDFLTQWPTLKVAQLARRTTLERFFRAHHVRYADVIDQRIQAIKRATLLTSDEGAIAPNALLVQALVSRLRVTLRALETFDHAMAPHAQSHPDFPLFAALPGAGAVFAPRLLVAFGEPRDRYASADELQKYAGIAPVTETPRQHDLGSLAPPVSHLLAKRSWNGRLNPRSIPSGHAPTTSNNAISAAHISPPSGP